MTLEVAIEEVRRVSGGATTWDGWDFCGTTKTNFNDAVATIINAVVTGDLIPRADLVKAEARGRTLLMDAMAALVSARDTIRRIWGTTNPERERVIDALSDALGVEVVPVALRAGKGETK